ncbi:class I adenylate-forming enzyme family protein [Pararhodobacter aggregans]|uniref:AMP-dependent synthetase n=1 Tax=Pararhodobacter aggregans TaxID=404875 RepID=A0A2T7UR10_9RHOB|nr:class I adenylate-forming enzyme family protein [Pararhodobacter aggregans]PTX01978.1 crotonobetaine/carnitine-CoA ligase [Pararhodobacter aggregans]PVE47163.1 hypothetical protein DDE23_13015 [Pararhodobacter aggregans]
MTDLPTDPVLKTVSGASIAPPFPNIGAFIHDCARRFADTIVIDCFEDDERLTYQAYDRLSNSVANGLEALSVGPGDKVATMMANSIAYPVIWAGLSKLGAAIVPVPTSYTAAELDYILGDSEAVALIVDDEFLPLFEGLRAGGKYADLLVIRRGGAGLPDVAGLMAGDDSPRDLSGIGPDAINGLQYTSGSTGSPKGCIVTQDYWMLLGRSLGANIRSPIRTILSPHSFNYMNGRNLLLTIMERGGTFYLGRRPSTSKLLGWIRDLGIHFTFFPSIALTQPESPDEADTPLMEVSLSASPPSVHREFARRFPGVKAFELYGMTEVGAVLAGDPDDPAFFASGRLGVEMLGRAVTIRDPEGNECPPGVAGELWVAGPAMFKGYYGRPEATAEVFRGPWARTGDSVLRGEDGYIRFIGRIKDIVRRSNENISALEVETVGREAACIAECAVVPEPDAERGEEVKIFIRLAEGCQADRALVEALDAHFRARLAAFKCPRYYAFVEDFPRTPSQKIRKGILRSEPQPTIFALDAKGLRG